MKLFAKLLFFTVVVGMLTGCASILGGSGPQAITVNSTPSDAKLEVTDLITGQSVFIANTPCTMMLNRSSSYFNRSQYKIKVSKDGYVAQEQELIPRISGWYMGGNVLFGSLIGWFIVDPATGAMYTFDEKQVTCILYADTEAGHAALKADQERKALEHPPKKQLLEKRFKKQMDQGKNDIASFSRKDAGPFRDQLL